MAAPLLLLLPFLLSSAAASASDAAADHLLLLKQSFSDPSSLPSWSPSTSPCDRASPWAGVACSDGAVTALRLESLSLSGGIDVDALGGLPALRSLSFFNNSFSGPIPPLNRLAALKALYLHRNRFSGDIPADFFAPLTHLKKLYLANNRFTGPIPPSLSSVSTLMELHLEGNRFSGPIPQMRLPALFSLDLSKNALSGAIPVALGAKFDARSFSGNPGLCGLPLANRPCDARALQAAAAAAASAAMAPPPPPPPRAEGSGHGSAVTVVVSALLIATLAFAVASAKRRRQQQRRGEYQTLGMDSGLVRGVGEAASAKAGSAGGGRKEASGKAGSTGGSATQRSGARSLRGGGGGGGGGKGEKPGDLVMVNEEKGVFALSDLMKAAAEVLGNGGMGSAYKAVMGNGLEVAVKRMKDMNRVGKETFDMELRRLGRLKHKNVLPPLAYHYRKEEKLLIYEHIPKGSLLYVLHGNRGPEHEALDWPTRMTILVGIARGMAHLHAELTSVDIPHGNLKSGNVLLSSDFEPLLVDYGYVPLVNPSQASQSMFAYKSPESVASRHVCPKSDVYCLGIVVLEVLTGRFPSQYLNNNKGGTDVVEWANSAIGEDRVGELLDPAIVEGNGPALLNMERLIRVGAACVEPDLERRPSMKEACRQIEEAVEGARKAIESGGGTTDASGTSHTVFVREGSPSTATATATATTTATTLQV